MTPASPQLDAPAPSPSVSRSSPRWIRGYAVVELALGLTGAGALSVEKTDAARQEFDTDVQPGFKVAGYFAPWDFLHVGVSVMLLQGDVSLMVATPSGEFAAAGSTTTFCASGSFKLGGALGPLWIGFAGDIGLATWTAEEGNSFVGLSLFPRLVVDTLIVGSRRPGFKMGFSVAIGALIIPTATTSQEFRADPFPPVFVDFDVWKTQLTLTAGLIFGG
jgi:hypothetical protein